MSNDMCHLAIMSRKLFEFGSIEYIVYIVLASDCAYYHSLFETI